MQPTILSDIVYGRKFGMALTLDVVLPPTPSGVGVIGLSSGGWHSWPEAGKPQTDEFLKRGQTFIIATHGARPKFGIPEIVQDFRRAIRFVRAHADQYGMDPRRLGLFGISSGGNISLLTAAQGGAGDPEAKDPVDRESDRVGAVACFYPPTDLRNFGEPGKIWIPYRPPEETRDDAALAEAYSPVVHFTSEMPPTLIMHGDQDELVPMQQGRVAIQRLSELNVPHHFEERPGKGHGWADMSVEYAVCAEWLDRHLGE